METGTLLHCGNGVAARESLAPAPGRPNKESLHELHFFPRQVSTLCWDMAEARQHQPLAWPWVLAPYAEPGC